MWGLKWLDRRIKREKNIRIRERTEDYLKYTITTILSTLAFITAVGIIINASLFVTIPALVLSLMFLISHGLVLPRYVNYTSELIRKKFS